MMIVIDFQPLPTVVNISAELLQPQPPKMTISTVNIFDKF